MSNDLPTNTGRRRAGLLLPCLVAAAWLSACAVPGGASTGAVATDAVPHCGPQNYPFPALENEDRGDVVLRVNLDAAGQVVSAATLVSGPGRHLDGAALAGVRSCRFAAAAAPRTLDVVVAFRFRNDSEIPPQGVVTIAARSSVPQGAAPAAGAH